MRRRKRRTGSVALVLLVACASLPACGAPAPSDGSARTMDQGHWAPVYSGHQRPNARNARIAPPFVQAPGLTLWQSHRGYVWFGAYQFCLGSDCAPRDAEDAELERRDAVEALSECLRKAWDRAPSGEGGQQPVLRLSIERLTRWAAICDVLRLCLEAEPRIERMHILTTGRRRSEKRRLDAWLARAAPGAAPGGEGARLSVRLEESSPEAPIELRIGERMWTIPAQAAAHDAAFVARVNKRWGAVAEELAATTTPLASEAVLHVSSTVCWAYVVTVLDLLMEHGASTVALPALGITLRLELPPRPDPLEAPPLRDVGTATTLLAMMLGLIVGALIFVPRIRPRRGLGLVLIAAVLLSGCSVEVHP